jgi:hypothetical protein
MPNIQKGQSVFFQGISDYWLRFFADDFIIRGLGAGSQYLAGQAYFDLLTAYTRFSLKDMPVFDKHRWQLLVLSTKHELTEGGQQAFMLPYTVRNFKFVYNKIYNPERIFEESFDFSIQTTGEKAPKKLIFKNNIDVFAFDNVAKRVYTETDGNVVTEVAFWLPNTSVDEEWLFKDYGILIDRRNTKESSEQYRAFTYGLFNYFMKGPTLERVESALNIINNIPVARQDGEIVELVNSSTRTVVTDKNIYTLPIRATIGVKEGDVLHAFQPLSDSFEVGDYISKPDWWDGIYLNPNVMSSTARIYADLGLLADIAVGTFNYSDYEANPNFPPPQDPYFAIGPYPVGFETSELLSAKLGAPHQRHIYNVFNNMLKHHNFFIRYNALFPATQDAFLLDSVLRQGRLAYTNYTLIPYVGLETEFFEAGDLLLIIYSIGLEDNFFDVCPTVGRPIEHAHEKRYNDDGNLEYVNFDNTSNNSLAQNSAIAKWNFNEPNRLINLPSGVKIHGDKEDIFVEEKRVGFSPYKYVPAITKDKCSGLIGSPSVFTSEFDGVAWYFSFTVTEEILNIGDIWPLMHKAYFVKDDSTNDWCGFRLAVTKKVGDIITFEFRVVEANGTVTVIDYQYDPTTSAAAFEDNELYNNPRGLYVLIDQSTSTEDYPYAANSGRQRLLMYLDGELLTLDGVDGVDNILDAFSSGFVGLEGLNADTLIGKSLEFDDALPAVVETFFPGILHDYQVFKANQVVSSGPIPVLSEVGRRFRWLKKPRVVKGLGKPRQSLFYKKSALTKSQIYKSLWFDIPRRDEFIFQDYKRPILNEHIIYEDALSGDGYNVVTHQERLDFASYHPNTVYNPLYQDLSKAFSPFYHIFNGVFGGNRTTYGPLYANFGLQVFYQIGHLATSNLAEGESLLSGITPDPGGIVELNGDRVDNEFYSPEEQDALLKKHNPFKELFSKKDFTVRTFFQRNASFAVPYADDTVPDSTNSQIIFCIESSTGSRLAVIAIPHILPAAKNNDAPFFPELNPRTTLSPGVYALALEIKRDGEPLQREVLRTPDGNRAYFIMRVGTNNLTVIYKAYDGVTVIIDAGHPTVPMITPYIANDLLVSDSSLANHSLADTENALYNFAFQPKQRVGVFNYFKTTAGAKAGPISPILYEAAKNVSDITDPLYSFDLLYNFTMSPDSELSEYWAHGALNTEPWIVKRNKDIVDAYQIDAFTEFLTLELYNKAFTNKDVVFAQHVVTADDPYLHADCNPDYAENLKIDITEDITGTAYLMYNFRMNFPVNPNFDISVSAENLLALPDTQNKSLVSYIPPEIENLLTLLDTEPFNIELGLESGADLLTYLDTEPMDIEVSEFVNPDDIITLPQDIPHVADPDLIHAFTILNLTVNSYIYSAIANDLIYNFVPVTANFDEQFMYNYGLGEDSTIVYNLTFSLSQEVQSESLTLLYNYTLNSNFYTSSGLADGMIYNLIGDPTSSGNEVTNESSALLYNHLMSDVAFQNEAGLIFSFTFNHNKLATDLPLQFL